MAPRSNPSKSNSRKSATKRTSVGSRKGKSQSRSASSKPKSRSRSTAQGRGTVRSKSRATSVARSRSRPSKAPRSRSSAKPSAAAGQASASTPPPRADSQPVSRPAATKRRGANDSSKPEKPKRKMTAYNVFVKEHLTGSADVKDSMKEAAERWKHMSPEEKNRYKLDGKRPVKRSKGSKPGVSRPRG